MASQHEIVAEFLSASIVGIGRDEEGGGARGARDPGQGGEGRQGSDQSQFALKNKMRRRNYEFPSMEQRKHVPGAIRTKL